TTAAAGDIQLAAVGSGSPNRTEIRCGANKIVDTIATGDDVQLIAFGAPCKNVNTPVIDTGDNGLAETTAASDDTQEIATGVHPRNTPCVITGGAGGAQTRAASGDDNQQPLPGAAEPNTAVVLCGPNLIADTTANNLGAGDDVQLVPVGAACTANQVVVDSGADGIATTRAGGPDPRSTAAQPLKGNSQPRPRA